MHENPFGGPVQLVQCDSLGRQGACDHRLALRSIGPPKVLDRKVVSRDLILVAAKPIVCEASVVVSHSDLKSECVLGVAGIEGNNPLEDVDGTFRAAQFSELDALVHESDRNEKLGISIGPLSDASNRVDRWVSGDTSEQNYYVTVNAKYDFQLFTPLMQQLVGNPIHMSVSVQMRTNY